MSCRTSNYRQVNGNHSKQNIIGILEAVAARGARVRSNRVLALVRSIYRWGIAEDLIHFDPTQGVRPRSVERPRERAEPEEMTGGR